MLTMVSFLALMVKLSARLKKARVMSLMDQSLHSSSRSLTNMAFSA